MHELPLVMKIWVHVIIAGHLVEIHILTALLHRCCILIHITNGIHLYYDGQLNLPVLCNPAGNCDPEKPMTLTFIQIPPVPSGVNNPSATE